MDFNGSPSENFCGFCRLFHDEGSNNTSLLRELQDFRVILHLIMRKCYKDDILAGRKWLLEHCDTVPKADIVMKYILSLAKGRKRVDDRLHLLYLISDVLFHASKRDMTRFKTAENCVVLENLILSIKSEQSGLSKYEMKIAAVIDFWGKNRIFDPKKIDKLHHIW